MKKIVILLTLLQLFLQGCGETVPKMPSDGAIYCYCLYFLYPCNYRPYSRIELVSADIFNKDGNQLEHTTFDYKGDKTRYVFIYDSLNRKTANQKIEALYVKNYIDYSSFFYRAPLPDVRLVEESKYDNDTLRFYRKYKYDQSGKLLKEFHIRFGDYLRIFEKDYKYNGSGLLDSICSHNIADNIEGCETKIKYDERGNIIDISGYFMPIDTVKFKYDEKDKLIERHSKDFCTDYWDENTHYYQYDENGNMIRDISHTCGFTKRYIYNENGKISDIYQNDSYHISFFYNSEGTLAITKYYEYDTLRFGEIFDKYGNLRYRNHFNDKNQIVSRYLYLYCYKNGNKARLLKYQVYMEHHWNYFHRLFEKRNLLCLY